MSNFGFPVEPPPNATVINLSSLAQAQIQSLASFPVKVPSSLPEGYQLSSFIQAWPEHIDAARRSSKVHADWVVSKYVNPAGGTLQIVQGFSDLYFFWTMLNPPADSSGQVDVNGRSAAWVTANPAPGEVPRLMNGRPSVGKWQANTDFLYLGWQDGVHPAPQGGVGDSPRFYGLAADKLALTQLVSIAKSVAVTPFVSP